MCVSTLTPWPPRWKADGRWGCTNEAGPHLSLHPGEGVSPVSESSLALGDPQGRIGLCYRNHKETCLFLVEEILS